MNFKENKPIYIQIAEHIADEVLADTLKPDGRIPSVREYAVMVEVNANTVVRSYDYLQQNGVIYNRRGLGYFVAPDAKKLIIDIRRKKLLGEDLTEMMQQLALLGVTPEELCRIYTDFLDKKGH